MEGIADESAQRPKIHNLMSRPQSGTAKRCVDEWINFARFRASNHPATGVDSADVGAFAAWKGAEIGEDPLVPSKNVRDEASRGAIAIVAVRHRKLSFSR